ncbi:hypothetical protein [Treponema sp. R80B11-R83G3]
MLKNIFHVASKLVAVLLLGITVTGCATTHHGIEISNVSNIREIYIRNAGTTNWGTNIASKIKDINKSEFSEMVDIRVIDTGGVVYSKYNIPFNDAVFVETSKTSSINPFAGGLLAIGLLGAIGLIPKP